jgi:hypothetical protein
MMAASAPQRVSRHDRDADAKDPQAPTIVTSAVGNNPEAGVGHYPALVRNRSIFACSGHTARFPMLAAEKRSLPSKPSCDHEDIETQLPTWPRSGMSSNGLVRDPARPNRNKRRPIAAKSLRVDC